MLLALMFCAYCMYDKTDPKKSVKVDELNKSGYTFKVRAAKINSKYSEIPSTMFRNKLVIVSSKKIGAIGNGMDSKTKEPYTDLFYSDVSNTGNFSLPLWFSSKLNTKNNEGQVAFSPNEKTIYYTRSMRKKSSNYKLFKAELNAKRRMIWENEIEIEVSSDEYSVENPHVSVDGRFLYFSSNMKGGFGGFDIYMARINNDGSIGTAINLGGNINTSKDEKYPHTTKDNKELYFSSTGHNSIGGYDVFISNRKNSVYSAPRNLGMTINSTKDDLAFIIIEGNTGVFLSNKGKRNKGFNMYHFKAEMTYKDSQGVVTTNDNRILPNATVVLLNSEGEEIERQTTGVDASYRFKIRPFENYQIIAEKDGYENCFLQLKPDRYQQRAVLKMVSKVEVSYTKTKR